jgi:hypothetical protein
VFMNQLSPRQLPRWFLWNADPPHMVCSPERMDCSGSLAVPLSESCMTILFRRSSLSASSPNLLQFRSLSECRDRWLARGKGNRGITSRIVLLPLITILEELRDLHCLFMDQNRAFHDTCQQSKIQRRLKLRYRAYAYDHGMTSEQILAHDKACYPFSLLVPYLPWLNHKWLEWNELNPGRSVHGAKEHADFDRWLEQLIPRLDALTCECHAKMAPSRSH